MWRIQDMFLNLNLIYKLNKKYIFCKFVWTIFHQIVRQLKGKQAFVLTIKPLLNLYHHQSWFKFQEQRSLGRAYQVLTLIFLVFVCTIASSSFCFFSNALYLIGSWDIGSQCNEKLINQLKLFQLFRLVEVLEVRPKLFKVSSFWETEESPTLFRCVYN